MSRGGQIRTDDFLLPKQALYQAELRPVADWSLESITLAISQLTISHFFIILPAGGGRTAWD